MDQAEEYVLRAYVVVVEQPRFLLCEDDDAAGSVGEAFEQRSASDGLRRCDLVAR